MTTVRVVLCMFRAVSNTSILSCHTCIHVIVCFTGSIIVVTLSNFVGNYSLLADVTCPAQAEQMQRNVVRLHNLLSNNAEARAHSAFVDAKFAELRTMLASRKGVRDEELAKAKVCTVPVCRSILGPVIQFSLLR